VPHRDQNAETGRPKQEQWEKKEYMLNRKGKGHPIRKYRTRFFIGGKEPHRPTPSHRRAGEIKKGKNGITNDKEQGWEWNWRKERNKGGILEQIVRAWGG